MSVPLEDAEGKAPTSDPFQEEQTVLILVGLIASGKSTFAKALEGYYPRFCRCNQDELGNRQQVEGLTHRTLCEGRSPCIDRTNFNAIQRSYWSAIARAFPGTSISIIVFDTPYHVCASRLERRTSHPTIRDARHGLAVLRKFASDFEVPSPEEGYDHILYLRPADHPRAEYTRSDVFSILERLKASTLDAGRGVAHGSNEARFGPSAGYGRAGRARGLRGSSLARGSVDGSPRFASRVGGSTRCPSSGATTNRGRSAAVANMPPKEGSKGERDSAEECHSCS